VARPGSTWSASAATACAAPRAVARVGSIAIPIVTIGTTATSLVAILLITEAIAALRPFAQAQPPSRARSRAEQPAFVGVFTWTFMGVFL
jgi:tetrahydromethanopterin S-methyltransferase subunit C